MSIHARDLTAPASPFFLCSDTQNAVESSRIAQRHTCYCFREVALSFSFAGSYGLRFDQTNPSLLSYYPYA
jgi:hypothetical protein